MATTPPRNSMGLLLAMGLALVATLAATAWYAWPSSSPSVTATAKPSTPDTPLADVWPSPVPASPSLSPSSPEPTPARPLAPAAVDPAAVWIGQSAEALTPPHLPMHRGTTGWEAQIDSILAETVPDSVKAERLFSRLADLPPDAYDRATREAVARLRDADYLRVVRPLLIDPRTHGAIESVLFADLLERPDSIALPTLVDIAEQTEHPFAESAADNLDLIVEGKDGGAWAKWKQTIAQMREGMKKKPIPIEE